MKKQLVVDWVNGLDLQTLTDELKEEIADMVDEIDVAPEPSRISIREQFAGMAMQGLLARYNMSTPSDQDTVVALSVELADTLLSKLNE